MLQTRVQDGQISADSNLQHSAFLRNTARAMSKKPALVLAFLVAIVGVIWVAAAQMNASRNLELPTTHQQANIAGELEAADEKAQVSGESNSDAIADGNTNSVKIESVTNNGVTETTLEVNGRDVPVEPNGTTHVTLPNGSQTITNNVTTQNTQTGGGYNFNSNTFSSSSSSYNSSSNNYVGGP